MFRLHQLARRLWPLRRACLALVLVSAVMLMFFTLSETPAAPSRGLRLSLLFTLWMLLLYSFIHVFQRIPSPVLPALPWWERARQRVYLWCYYLLAVCVLVAALLLVNVSLKLWLL
ncbi:MAG: hypothetical protein LBE21_03310 [Pseudomonadales bacterium]|nr:hypothetical protein [Pseudomonadales bacterium]